MTENESKKWNAVILSRRREDLSAVCNIISNGKQIAASFCCASIPRYGGFFVILTALANLQHKNLTSAAVVLSTN